MSNYTPIHELHSISKFVINGDHLNGFGNDNFILEQGPFQIYLTPNYLSKDGKFYHTMEAVKEANEEYDRRMFPRLVKFRNY
jgi:hypothetical protein